MRQLVSWRPPLWLVMLLVACALVIGTGAGYVQGAFMNGGFGGAGSASGGRCTESAEVCKKFDNFWQVWNVAERRFVDPSALDSDKMIAGAINGMLDTLGDQGHTRYDTAEQFQREQESQAGEYEGIGAYVGEENGVPIIVAPIEGSPAEAAGIQSSDQIVKIDGQSVEGLTTDDIVRRIRGKPGSQVVLTVRHLGEEGTEDISITRAAINVPAVTWTMLPGKVAHIKLAQFSEKALAELKPALQQAREQGAEKIIFDLRNNPGGLLDQAVSVTSQFIAKDQPVLTIRGRDGKEEVYKSNEDNPVTDLPMVVLTNTGSASSSEIFASAIQDYGRAKVIGLQTIGLGTVITPVELDDGSAVYIGTAEWITPKGRQLRKEGVVPDIEVALPPEVQALTPSAAKKLSEQEILQTKDTQLRRALQELGVLPPEPDATATP